MVQSFQKKTSSIFEPPVVDILTIDRENIAEIMPNPLTIGTTSSQKNILKFDYDVSEFQAASYCIKMFKFVRIY